VPVFVPPANPLPPRQVCHLLIVRAPLELPLPHKHLGLSLRDFCAWVDQLTAGAPGDGGATAGPGAAGAGAAVTFAPSHAQVRWGYRAGAVLGWARGHVGT
jgi:hypothetical protein